MTPDEARSLGRAIRTVRTERGLTQMKAALAAGISDGQLRIWERGSVPAVRGKPLWGSGRIERGRFQQRRELR